MPRLVGVCSGKGGVGKSTVSVNLALGLRDLGLQVGLVDADLYGPDIPRMLNITRRTDTRFVTLWNNPRGSKPERIAPVEHLGLRLMSAQFLMGESQAFSVSAGFGAMLLRRFVYSVDWSATDVVIVDLPPGTADLEQQATSMPEMAGCVVVTTPQDVAHLDGRKLVSSLTRRNVRVLGGVENMASFRCPCCDAEIELFRPTPHERSIWAAGVTKLASIPFDADIGDGDRAGVPVVHAKPHSAPATAFAGLAAQVRGLAQL